MCGCAAPKCSSSSSKGIRVFRFPADKDRRAKWVKNCRRENWKPTMHSKLCEVHFEENQFEQNRADKKKKLKPNAIPTIFNVRNPTSQRRTNKSNPFEFIPVKQEPPDTEPDESAAAHIEFEAVKQEVCDDLRPGESAVSQGFEFVSVKQEPLAELKDGVQEDFITVKEEPPEDTESADSPDDKDYGAVEEDFTRFHAATPSLRRPNNEYDFMFPEVILKTDEGYEASAQAALMRNISTQGSGENNRRETVTQQYVCCTCFGVFLSKYSMTRHVFSHLEGVEPPPHICRLCGLVVSTADALAEHTRSAEALLPSLWDTVIIEKTLSCDMCQEDFKADGCLRAHLAEHSGCGSTSVLGDTAAGHIYECPMCSLSCETSDALEEHECVHNVHQLYECKLCGKYFDASSSLDEHYLTHGNKRFRCNFCDRSFIGFSSLRYHTARLHTGEKPYRCCMCRKKFADSSSLSEHKRVHGEKQLSACGVCGKHFSRESNLSKHMRIHTRAKECVCDICHKSFKSRSSLIQHRKVHFGGSPHTCNVCGKSFSFYIDCKKHEKTHITEKIYNCDTCGKCFSLKEDIMWHVRSHMGLKSYKCDLCCKTFISALALARHKNKHLGKPK